MSSNIFFEKPWPRRLNIYADICGDQCDGLNLYGISVFDLHAGCVLALWIAPKRLNQVARQAVAVTMPEVLYEKFDSGVDHHNLFAFFMFLSISAVLKRDYKKRDVAGSFRRKDSGV